MHFSPKIDLVFRKLFGSEENKDLLISLINSIVGPGLIVSDLIIKNPYNLASYVGSRESILDVKAVDEAGKWYDIEMQIAPQAHYGRRALYYLSKIYVDQLSEGDGFDELRETIGIHFLDFGYFPGDRYIRQFGYRDVDTHETHQELGYQRLFFIELSKFRKEWSELSTTLDRWISFLNRAELLERGTVPAELSSEPAIARAVSELDRMGLDAQERQLYEREVKARMVDAATLQYTAQRAAQEAKEHLLLRLISKRFGPSSTDLVARLDRLKSEQLDELAEALFDLNSRAEVDDWLASRQNPS